MSKKSVPQEFDAAYESIYVFKDGGGFHISADLESLYDGIGRTTPDVIEYVKTRSGTLTRLGDNTVYQSTYTVSPEDVVGVVDLPFDRYELAESLRLARKALVEVDNHANTIGKALEALVELSYQVDDYLTDVINVLADPRD